jgi:hypothetical protein
MSQQLESIRNIFGLYKGALVRSNAATVSALAESTAKDAYIANLTTQLSDANAATLAAENAKLAAMTNDQADAATIAQAQSDLATQAATIVAQAAANAQAQADLAAQTVLTQAEHDAAVSAQTELANIQAELAALISTESSEAPIDPGTPSA